MALKLRLAKERIKINYREDNENNKSPVLATFYVEPLTSTELNDLFMKYQKTEWLSPNKKTKKELHKEPDYNKVFKERFCKEIVSWEGIEDIKTDKPIKCTRQNILAIWDLNPGIINWVMEQVDEIKEAQLTNKEERAKN